jgi:hypothetical protein
MNCVARVDKYLDAPDARFRLRQHGARLQIRDALLEGRNSLQQLLTLELGGLGRSRRRDRNVEGLGPIGHDLDAGTSEGRQARRRDNRKFVLPGRQVRQGVRSLSVGGGRELGARFRVGRGDGRVGDGCAARVPDRSSHAAAVIGHVHRLGGDLGLGFEGRRVPQYDDCDNRDSSDYHLTCLSGHEPVKTNLAALFIRAIAETHLKSF